MMASLHFIYGSMNSGKSTRLIQVKHNYERTGKRVIVLKSPVDTKSESVSARIGLSADVDFHVSDSADLVALVETENAKSRLACVLVDEAQFLSVDQAKHLLIIATRLGIPVMAYGLRTDFRAEPFPASAALLAYAHHINEIVTVCECERKATTVGRRGADGNFVKEGAQIVIDGDATYEPLCSRCYDQHIGL